MNNTQFTHVKYSFFFAEIKEIKIFIRIQHIVDNRIQGTKDIEIANIKISNKYDAKKLVSFLASCDYDLFSLLRAIEDKAVELKGSININSIK